VPHIERIISELLDQVQADVAAADSFNFIQTVARPLPVHVITQLLGIERGQRADFMAWSDELAIFIGTPQPTREQAPPARQWPAGAAESSGAMAATAARPCHAARRGARAAAL
jgi:cytochrome P450